MTPRQGCVIEPPNLSLGDWIVNTAELVAKLAETQGVTKAQVKATVDAFLKELVEGAASGAEISLPGFGKFKVKATAEREGRNPANGEKIKIAASKKLTFAPAKAVKDFLNP
jgi:DNA-binding protein HU-beta